MTTHQVAAGDHISRVARTHGHRVYAPVWNDPGNAELRKQRDDPHILAVGDLVAVPDPVQREVVRVTEKRHQFRLKTKPLRFRFTLQQWQGRSDEDDPTSVLLGGEPVERKSAGKSTHEVVVDATSDRCVIVSPRRELLCRVGFLQPVETVAGYRERLNNLGYRAGDSDAPSDRQLRSAVEEFQCDQELAVDGVVGPKTRAALVFVHGS